MARPRLRSRWLPMSAALGVLLISRLSTRDGPAAELQAAGRMPLLCRRPLGSGPLVPGTVPRGYLARRTPPIGPAAGPSRVSRTSTRAFRRRSCAAAVQPSAAASPAAAAVRREERVCRFRRRVPHPRHRRSRPARLPALHDLLRRLPRSAWAPATAGSSSGATPARLPITSSASAAHRWAISSPSSAKATAPCPLTPTRFPSATAGRSWPTSAPCKPASTRPMHPAHSVSRTAAAHGVCRIQRSPNPQTNRGRNSHDVP